MSSSYYYSNPARVVRKNVPLQPDLLRLLGRLTTKGTREYYALRGLIPNVRNSEASVLAALISLGCDTVLREALTAAYAELSDKMSSQESPEDGHE
jgi:hypothetical protein